MLPDTAFPGPLPLSRADALKLLDRLDEFDVSGGVFLTFVMVPLEERIGAYRFAGACTSLAGAVRRIDQFALEDMGFDLDNPSHIRFLVEEVTEGGYDGESHYPKSAPVGVAGTHRLILCVQSPAPYDHCGVCIVEVASLNKSGYEGKEPDTTPPEEWHEPAIEWALEKGTEQFGEPSEEMEDAIRNETRLEVWGTWAKRWDEFTEWADLLKPPTGK